MITMNVYYKGKNGAGRLFVQEMERSGIADRIRASEGNLGYEYYISCDDETVLLIDSWTDQNALDRHHESDVMEKIIELREKYNLHMNVKSFVEVGIPTSDEKYIRR